MSDRTREYELVVRWTRQLQDDIDASKIANAEMTDEELKLALRKQLAGEIQEAINEYGIPAGGFEVEWGRWIPEGEDDV